MVKRKRALSDGPPSDEQIAKLPKWAQEHVADLEMQRDNARAALNKFEDDQTESNVWTEDYVFDGGREGIGLAHRTKYIQSERVEFYHQGVALTVSIRENEGIHLSWGAENCHGMGDVSFVPSAYQQARLSNVVYNEYELDRLFTSKERREKKCAATEK